MHSSLGGLKSLDGTDLVEGILDITCHLRGEDRTRVHRLRNWLLPCSKQTFH